MKKILPFLFACLLTPAIALAQPAAPARPTTDREQARPTPDQILKQGIEDLQDFLASSKGSDLQALGDFVEKRIAPQFDMVTMARWSGGYWYRQMTPEQRLVFTRKLAKYFFTSLAKIVAGYKDNVPEVRFMPPRFTEKNKASVAARVYPSNAYPIDVVFSFHRTPKGWRIFDVSTEGVSAVSYYRRMFNQQVRRYGSPEILYK